MLSPEVHIIRTEKTQNDLMNKTTSVNESDS